MSEITKYTQETFDSIKERMIKLIPEQTYLKEVSFAIQALRNNSYLAQCTRESILTAVYNTATTGLTLNPVMKFAAMVPRYIKNVGQVAVLEPMYQGLVKLVTDTGSAKKCYSFIVYEGDEFEPTYGTTIGLRHIPKFKSKKISHVYAVAVLHDDSIQFEVLTAEEVYGIRDRSESYKAYKDNKVKSCIWVSDEGEMFKKTAIKRLVKYLPKTDRYEKLANAIDLDNKDYEVSDNQREYVEHLMDACEFTDEEKKFKRIELNQMNGAQVAIEIDNLKQRAEALWSTGNGSPKGSGGGRLSQKVITNAVKEAADKKNT